MYKLGFYVPESHLASVKEALFAAGAGRIGQYDHCCWQVLGQGQFRPLSGSAPALGQHYRLEQVAEWRVEMVCATAVLDEVLAALRRSHPYEEPAFDVVALITGI
ncbi:MAG: NGG1p interacting factor NIF3 [Pseudohongiellaceae bacterium]|jgi:hypothetical protein